MKPNLTVFVAAGSSFAFGIPGTASLTTSVLSSMRDAEIAQQALLPPLSSGTTRTDLLFAHLQRSFGPATNFEHLLHALEALASLIRTWSPSTAPKYKIVEGVLCGGPHGVLAPCFDQYFPIVVIQALYERVYGEMINASARLSAHPDWPAWVALLTRLKQKFDVTFATTNYDHVLESALAFAPEDEGFFPIPGESMLRFSLRKRPSLRLLHLHGNLRFGYRNSGDPNRFRFEDEHEDLYWYEHHTDASRTWFNRSTATSGAGNSLNVGPIITGLHKPDKLLAEPYRTYAEEFFRALRESERLLVIGYGFGDPHLNYVLRRMTKWHGSKRRVAYIGHNASWPPVHTDFSDNLFTIACWAEESAPLMSQMSPPLPYLPATNGQNCFQGWFSGLNHVLQDGQDSLVSFLNS